METNRSSTQPEREQLRQRWMANASAAFELMFGDAQQKQLVTLTQREERACQMAQDLAVWLLEQHVTADSAAQPEPDQVCCPKCQRPARRVTQADTPPPDTPQADTPQSNTPPPDALHSHAAPPGRLVTTLAGEIEFAREQWRCPRCRILFFSAR
jgi:hypothetical protein